MILKINKALKEIRFGIIGTRSVLLQEVLDELKIINYQILKNCEEISDEYDMVLMSGVHYIIPGEVLTRPTYGVFGFHETPLPEGRGFAPIYWTIKNGRPNFTISMYQADTDIDTGRLVCQYNVPVLQTDTYASLSEKRGSGIQGAFRIFIEELENGIIVLREQTGLSTKSPKRKPEDSELDTSKSLLDLWDDIRCCDNENFPAFFTIDNKKILVKYEVVD